jgi:hypothetical protein
VYVIQRALGSSGDGYCFYKFWELGYRADGQTKFLMQSVDELGKKFDAERTGITKERAKRRKPFFCHSCHV